MKKTLHILVQSFSYRKGYPEDPAGNGGGFVFDCRGILNPYRFGNLKYLTGKDKEVEEFFVEKTDMPEFIESIKKIIDITINNYLEREFSDLQINFGCTGGQHRSVYSAEKIALYIIEKYPQTRVSLVHRNSKNWMLK
ncbi:RapZ C-terminal domain-containing protein [Apibacter adventoris]|uniref:RapZ C-terminal domain-containing protein n=1 Tax=Apibacter adventoris TaxID=1679466 RepID=UPI000CF72D78|nr:RNase adapter RapZ [Apibacter adventoris]PQL96062.1 ATP-binding protein [Apibacter adventoris]